MLNTFTFWDSFFLDPVKVEKLNAENEIWDDKLIFLLDKKVLVIVFLVVNFFEVNKKKKV